MINEYPNGVIAQLLQAIIGQINFTGTPTSNIGDILLSILEQTPYDKEPKSAIAEILLSILNETEYDKEPNSRIAELLLELKSELESYAELTASGAIANFTTSVVKPLVNLTAYFKATQEAGTPTPQSPKAITGVSAVNVVHCGKNLVDIKPFNEWEFSNAYYLLFNCIPNKQVKMSFIDKDVSVDVSDIYFGFVDSNYNKVSALTPQQYRWCLNQGNIVNNRTNLSTQGDKILTGLVIYPKSEEVFYRLFARYNIVVSVNDETAYEPYNGSTTLINLGGTYYGGYVTQDKNGKRELVVTHELIDLGSRTWAVHQNGFYYNSFGDLIKRCEPSIVADLLAQKYQVKTAQYVYGHGSEVGLIGLNSNLMYVTDSATPSGLLVYPINEPFTVALPDGEPITAFNGVNNIYNDSGDTSVTYLAKIADNLNATAKFRAEVKAQKEKAKEELKEDVKEDVKELEPIKDSGEKKRGA